MTENTQELFTVINILDKIGIIAFAFVGISVGINKKLDIFGLILLGLVSAIGGGVIRDLLLNKTPYAISNIQYLEFAFYACIFSIIIYYFKIRIPGNIVLIFDTIGLGVFATAGAFVSINNNLSIFHASLLAIITAVGGGIIRDILVNDIPFILKREVYATAAGFGGAVCFILQRSNLSELNIIFIGTSVTIMIRLFAARKNYNLPTLK